MKEALVLRSTGSWYDLQTPDGTILQGRLRGKIKLKGLKFTNPIAVGDRVQYENAEDGTAIIQDISARQNFIVRKSTRKANHGHILAANIDQTVIIATLKLPRTSLGFIDRLLVTSESFRIPSLIVINKTDIYDDAELEMIEKIKAIYEPLGYPVLCTSVMEEKGIADLHSAMKGKVSLITGHSGTGKSSLINKLAPSLELKTGDVSMSSLKGTHTTTYAEMFPLDKNTYIVDSPGIKELGLINMEATEVSHYFPEMRERLDQCKFHNCTHTHEPQCAVISAVENGEIAASRYYNYISMVEGDDFKNS